MEITKTNKNCKTHKKVFATGSPASVSLNKYSVLSVDSMDCDSSAVFNVPSKGVPAKGSVLDVKLSVLNS